MTFMYTRVRAYCITPLFVNSAMLIGMRVVATLMGFVFWLIAARLMVTDAVGIATAAISATALLASFAQLGLGYVIIRYLAASGNPNALINAAINITSAAGMGLALVFLSGLDLWAHPLLPLRDGLGAILLFVMLVLGWTLSVLVHSIFVAMRKASYSLVRQASHAISAVVALLVISQSVPNAPGYFTALYAHIFGTWFSVGLSFYLLSRERPDYHYALGFSGLSGSSLKRYSFINYITEQFERAPETVLPLFVISLLGPSASAHFFIVWTMGKGAAAWISQSLAEALFAEGSNNPDYLATYAWRTARLGLLLATVFIIMVTAVGPLLLQFYGRDYVEQGYSLLVLIALAAVPSTLLALLSTVLRVQNRLRAIVVLTMSGNTLGIAASMIGIVQMGLIGAGIGWLSARTLILLVGIGWWKRNRS